MLAGKSSLLPRVAEIKRAVAAEYGVAVETMGESSRTPGAKLQAKSHPRQVAIALSSLLTEHSYVRIGQFFGYRDHSTVMSSCAAVARRRRADPKLHQAMRRMSLELVRRGG